MINGTKAQLFINDQPIDATWTLELPDESPRLLSDDVPSMAGVITQWAAELTLAPTVQMFDLPAAPRIVAIDYGRPATSVRFVGEIVRVVVSTPPKHAKPTYKKIVRHLKAIGRWDVYDMEIRALQPPAA